MVEVSKVAGPKNPSGRTAKPALEVLPISVRSPSTHNAKLPPTTPEDKERDCLGIEGDEDSLLTNSELAVEVVSSILRDSDLKRAGAIFVEEALALSLQEAATVCSNASICPFHRCFKLSINFISFLQMDTYMKILVRMASFAEGSARAVYSQGCLPNL